jgi:hypothetical protein
MRVACKKASPVAWHKAWMKKLDEDHFMLTAKIAYTCYEMYRLIVDMRKCLLPVDDEESSHKQSSGKRHKN